MSIAAIAIVPQPLGAATTEVGPYHRPVGDCRYYLHWTSMSLSPPTDDDKEELLLSCRYGDTEDIRLFIGRFGPDLLNDVRDDGGSCVLHMACGNGHLGKPSFSMTGSRS